MIIRYSLICIMLLSLSACSIFSNKSTPEKPKTLVITKGKLETSHIQKVLEEKNFKKKNIEAVFKLRYKDTNNEYDLSGQVKMQIGEYIWLNLSYFGLPVARAKITPNRFMLYSTFMDGHIDEPTTYLKNKLYKDITYKSLENIFLGNPLNNLSDKNWEITKINNNETQLKAVINPKKTIIMTVNSDVLITSEKIDDNRTKINSLFSSFDTNKIPNNITFKIEKGENNLEVVIEYKNITINKDKLITPFEIPEGSKRIR